MKHLLFLLLFCLFSTPAWALKIVNLDDKTHQLTIINGGENTRITLEPNAIYRTGGQIITIKNSTQTIRAHNRHEYAIYHGKLVLQKRDNTNDR